MSKCANSLCQTQVRENEDYCEHHDPNRTTKAIVVRSDGQTVKLEAKEPLRLEIVGRFTLIRTMKETIASFYAPISARLGRE